MCSSKSRANRCISTASSCNTDQKVSVQLSTIGGRAQRNQRENPTPDWSTLYIHFLRNGWADMAFDLVVLRNFMIHPRILGNRGVINILPAH